MHYVDKPTSITAEGVTIGREKGGAFGCELTIKDYDFAYFDASNLSYEAEDAVIRRVKAAFDEPLRSMVEVRNQARVHLWFEAKFGEPYGPWARERLPILIAKLNRASYDRHRKRNSAHEPGRIQSWEDKS